MMLLCNRDFHFHNGRMKQPVVHQVDKKSNHYLALSFSVAKLYEKLF